MKFFGEGFSEKHDELKKIIRNREKLSEAKQLFLALHASVHRSLVSGSPRNEVDALFDDLQPQDYYFAPSPASKPVAYHVWHLARIEDLTMNILMSGGEQVFNPDWQDKINAGITDTGNALTPAQAVELSKRINAKSLLYYRCAVGIRTRELVAKLSADDMRRKPSPESLDRLLTEGGLTEEADSIWLRDFWGKKDAAGLLLLPPTRHAVMHLNDCVKNTQRPFHP
ncbi:MAG: DinB family protein [Clostridiales bacterium]|jgi:hypothetical protein|nr:DinB family protein [Clostridiales bacterium]